MTQQADPSNALRAHRALLGPAWRFQLAPSLTPRVLKKFGDPWLTECQHYRAAQAAGVKPKRRATIDYDLVAAAVSLDGNSAQVRALKMMVVANMNAAEIEQRQGVTAAVVAAWEAVFFDVRDLRQATSWFAKHVFQAEQNRGNAELAARLKLAHCAGPTAVRALLDADQAIPLDIADQLLAERLQLEIKWHMASAMPIETREQALEFKKSVAELEVSMRRIELESRKLDDRCQRAREQHEITKLRCELAIKRTEQAAARADRRAADQELRQAAKQRRHESARRRRALQGDAERRARADSIAASPLAQIGWTTVADSLRQTSDCPDAVQNNTGADEWASALVDAQSPAAGAQYA